MTSMSKPADASVEARDSDSIRRGWSPLKFERTGGFQQTLRGRVAEHFERSGGRPRDCTEMYVKSAILLGGCVILYVTLVFFAGALWVAAPLAILLGLSLAAVAFNVQHDGGHGAYSDSPRINKLASLTLDLLGGSSYVWARKHNAIHHSYTNVTGHDDDINIGLLGRLSPHQRRRWFHCFQQFYLWVAYGFLPIKWHLFDDFRDVLRGRIGGHRFPRPRGRALLVFAGGKTCFFALAFGLPSLVHSFWIVVAFYLIASFAQGVTMSVVFQIAHCVEEASFPMPQPGSGRIASGWAAHQVETTVDFARSNRWVSWLVGGLNFQIEHHLFPQICHVHYPALAPIVESTCREFGLPYRSHRSILGGVISHFRWLRRMGTAESP